jgi:hypothetical protein
LLLKQLHLAYCIKDGLLIISSVDEVLQELKEAEAVGAMKEPPAESTAGGPTPVPSQPDPRSTPKPDIGLQRSRALELKLDQPITLSLPKETPLEDIFGYIKKATQAPDGTGLPIYVDPSVREKLKTLAQIDLEGVPLRTTLTLLLQNAQLGWMVQDGLLIISTGEKLYRIRRIGSRFLLPGGDVDPSEAMMAPVVRDPKMLDRFETPVSLSFPGETPLDEVIKAVRQATKGPDVRQTPIYLGPPIPVPCSAPGEMTINGVNVEMRAVGTLPVRINVSDVPLRTCLALLVAQCPELPPNVNESSEHGGLDCRVIDGVLVIGEPHWLRSVQIPDGGSGRGTGGQE